MFNTSLRLLAIFCLIYIVLSQDTNPSVPNVANDSEVDTNPKVAADLKVPTDHNVVIDPTIPADPNVPIDLGDSAASYDPTISPVAYAELLAEQELLESMIAERQMQEQTEHDMLCEDVAYPPALADAFNQHSDKKKVYLKSTKLKEQHLNKVKLDKYVTVFGIHILGTKDTKDDVLAYIAKKLARYLDQDQDGTVDNKKLVSYMANTNSMIALFKNEEEIDTLFQNLPFEYSCYLFLVPELTALVTKGHKEKLDTAKCPTDRNDYATAFIFHFLIEASNLYMYDKDKLKTLYDALEYAKENKLLDVQDEECDETCLLNLLQLHAIYAAHDLEVCSCLENGLWDICDAKSLKEKMPELYSFLIEHIKIPADDYKSEASSGHADEL